MAAVALGWLLGAAGPADALTLAEGTLSFGLGNALPDVVPDTLEGVALVLGTTVPTASEPGVVLFQGLTFTAATVGTSFTATPADPAFAAFAALLTDGIDGVLLVNVTTASTLLPFVGGAGAAESEALGLPPGTDLAGNSLDAFTLTLDAFAPGPFSPDTYDLTVSFEVTGQPVPEPAPGILVALGLAAWLGLPPRGRRA